MKPTRDKVNPLYKRLLSGLDRRDKRGDDEKGEDQIDPSAV